MKIITNEPINHRRLWAAGFKCRVGIDHTRSSIKPGVGNTGLTNPAVMPFDIFQKPLDGIKSIRTFIKVFGSFFRIMGPDILKSTFRHPAASYILIHKDIARFLKVCGGPEFFAVIINPIGCNAVRRSIKHERIGFRIILRHINRGEYFDPIAHRDLIFVLCVVCLHMITKLFCLIHNWCATLAWAVQQQKN